MTKGVNHFVDIATCHNENRHGFNISLMSKSDEMCENLKQNLTERNEPAQHLCPRTTSDLRTIFDKHGDNFNGCIILCS